MMEDKIIYHITTVEQWENAQDKGEYAPPSLNAEGFIHCSTKELLDGVMERHFPQQDNLVKLVIDTERVLNPIRYERTTSLRDAYPHIYGPLNLEAVTEIVFLGNINQ